MSKRGATLAALVHLLVVLSLVMESEQGLNLFGGKSEDWLWEQLEGILYPDQLLETMKKVSSEVPFGETSVKELIQLSKMTREDCNDEAYKKREEVCQKAQVAEEENVNEYCKNRLVRLTWFCPEHAPDYQGTHINPPASSDMVNYFFSLFKDYGSKILDKKVNHQLITNIVYAKDTEKEGELEANCLLLKRSKKQSGVIPSASAQSEANPDGPNWKNAYNVCKMFLDRILVSEKYES